MAPITISINDLKANELAALHSITSGMNRRAVMSALRSLVGPEAAIALTDKADELIDEVLVKFDAGESRDYEVELDRMSIGDVMRASIA